MQAVCDADSRFIYFGVIAPGRCSDQVAFERTSIFDQVAAFDTEFYLVGNAVYTFSDLMLVPFVGSQRDDPTQDAACNFLLSQLKIRIEMTFPRKLKKITYYSYGSHASATDTESGTFLPPASLETLPLIDFHDPALLKDVTSICPLPNTVQMLSVAKIRNLDSEE